MVTSFFLYNIIIASFLKKPDNKKSLFKEAFLKL